jgi:sugar/nucleoside kinase (ribokinase family)
VRPSAVELITIVGDDLTGVALKDAWEKSGNSTTGIMVNAQRRTPMTSAVMGLDGEVCAAVADTDAVESLDASWILDRLRSSSRASILAMDANLNTNVIQKVVAACQQRGVLVVFDCTSGPKSIRFATK